MVSISNKFLPIIGCCYSPLVSCLLFWWFSYLVTFCRSLGVIIHPRILSLSTDHWVLLFTVRILSTFLVTIGCCYSPLVSCLLFCWLLVFWLEHLNDSLSLIKTILSREDAPPSPYNIHFKSDGNPNRGRIIKKLNN